MFQHWHGVWFLVWVMSHMKTGSLCLGCINRPLASQAPSHHPNL